jgi:hypothetical protein
VLVPALIADKIKEHYLKNYNQYPEPLTKDSKPFVDEFKPFIDKRAKRLAHKILRLK